MNILYYPNYLWWQGDSIWIYLQRVEYTYDNNDNLIEETWQGWNNGTWIDGEKSIYTYDIHNNLIERLEQYWDGRELLILLIVIVGRP